MSLRAGSRPRSIPDGSRAFQIDFDFIDHRLIVATSDGGTRDMRLESQPLPEFYRKLFALLAELSIDVRIWPVPVELADAVPFTEDTDHSIYEPEIAERFWRILLIADMALTQFRGGFLGKASPVHFFWGSFDLAATRFSGRPSARASGRRAASCRPGDARSLLARSVELRLLARHLGRVRAPRLLRLCLSGAGRLRGRRRAPGAGVLQRFAEGVPPAL